MNISKYRAFLKVAATRSFSQAADQLHCTQSAASRMILDLENYWGFKLFSRMKGGAVLTLKEKRFTRSLSVWCLPKTACRRLRRPLPA